MKLEDDALIRLRDAMASLKRVSEAQIPRAALARLAGALPAGVGLTIDFDAAATLGHPMVVLRPSGETDPCFDNLSPREREVASLVAVGLRNKDIAIALGISLGTVKDHVHRILDKTGLDGRAGVAARWQG